MLLSIVEERAQERGEKIGEKRGEKRGEKSGEKRGEKRGATMKALAVAARMLDRGEPREKILDYVEISPKELDKLIESRRN